MTNKRIAYLKAYQEAARLHRQFGMRNHIEKHGGRIDVFDTITRCNLELLFQPLDNLLGAYLNHPFPGVLISTKRQLSVQRFTGAHELGHARLNHSPSIDEHLDWFVPSNLAQEQPPSIQEFEANSFAAEFILPKWLIASKLDHYCWSKKDILDPNIMYQLSLRVGVSYEALCRSLTREGLKLIDRAQAKNLLDVKPKKIKKNLLRGYKPSSMWSDIWELTPKDEGSLIEGSWSDIFLIRLTEHPSSGFVWDFEQLNQSGFASVRDERNAYGNTAIGGNI